MLPFENGEQVVEIEYLANEIAPRVELLKSSIVDVHCIDSTGRQFLVEMQVQWSNSFMWRVMFNASKAFVNQLGRAEKFEYLKPVYSINFVNTNYNKSPEYYHHYKMVNIRETNEQIKGLELIFIELRKFKPTNKGDRLLHDLWLRFLTEVEYSNRVPEDLLQHDEIREALDYSQQMGFT